MHFIVKPSAAGDATLSVPGDKSVSHRALMFAAIAEGESRVRGFLTGDDCLATMAALRSMGVTVSELADGALQVAGQGLHGLREPRGPLDLGNSGTGMRLFAGLLAGQLFDTVLIGDQSLSARPMGRVIDPLAMMGASIGSDGGCPPLAIRGGRDLQAIDYALPVASAQVKSAILLAGLYAAGETVVHEPAVTRDHSERMLRAMGADIESSRGTIRLRPGRTIRAVDIDIPGDLSSATFPIVAALVANRGRVVVRNVGINPTRNGVLTILGGMGANLRLRNERQCGNEPVADIEVQASRLRAVSPDPALVPLAIDEFPALFVAAACADGISEFRGLAELRVKESDRIAAMAQGLAALGIKVEEFPDGIRIHGGVFSGGSVESHGDHRIAMAFAVAGSVAAAPVTVRSVTAVDTSFPGFADTMNRMGLDIISVEDSPVITIDGPSGSGKGTIARRVAQRLGWELLDSGALYRLVGLAASRAGIEADQDLQIAELAASLPVRFGANEAGDEQIWLGGEEVSDEIRSEDAGRQASLVAALPAVRTALLGLQRGFRAAPGLVADGRDMGTQVFPDAPLKVYLTASADERAKRRYKQLKGKGLGVSLAALSRDIRDRDRRDSERSVAPLRPADDARILDSSNLTIDEVCETILAWADECLAAK